MAARVLDAWGLAGAPCRLIAQRENHVFRVETADGPRALRLHRPGYRSAADLRSARDGIAALADAGLTVPRPEPTRAGPCFCDAEGMVADLLHWIDGVPMGVDGRLSRRDDAPAADRALGAGMARLHAAADARVCPAGFTRPASDNRGLLGPAPLRGRFWENPTLSPALAALLALARDRARDRLAARAGSLDTGLIHADLVPENVILTTAGPAFIDFDDAGFGARAFDVATAANRALREDRPAALIGALVEGYTAHRALDLDDLGLFRALRAFTYVGWIVPRLAEPGARARNARFIALAERLARDLLDEKDPLHD